MRLVLYQPDIAPNAGAIMRLAPCLGLPLDLIEPCGFVLSDAGVRRAGMDYLDFLQLERHRSWPGYLDARSRASAPGRLVLLTTRGETPYTAFAYRPDDCLIAGRESAGVPAEVADAADARLRIPMVSRARSLNVATALALVLGEALRQTQALGDASTEALT